MSNHRVISSPPNKPFLIQLFMYSVIYALETLFFVKLKS